MWNLLKKYTEEDAQSSTKSTPNTNGWEAWRQIRVYFEAGTGQRDAAARQEFANMNNKKAKSPKEMKALMVDLEAKANKFKEITGKAPDEY